MTTAIEPTHGKERDDALTVCAISLIAAMLGDTLHEGVGHGALALFTVADSGVVSTVAWSSAVDSRHVAAGGTLVNLAAALVFWIVLVSAKKASPGWRYFLLLCVAFNLFTGTGYFCFSGVFNFGDWAVVIAGLPAHALWRVLLVAGGFAAYLGAVKMAGAGLVRYVGIPLGDKQRMKKLTLIPYTSAVSIMVAGGLLNPLGMQLIWQSALPAAAGGDSGLLWLRDYIPKTAVPERGSGTVGRSYVWIASAAILSLLFIFVLGRGIHLHR